MTADKRVITNFVELRARTDHPGAQVERWPDSENRRSSDIDAIAGRLAIEHTSVDTVPNQRRDSAWFMNVAQPLEDAFGSSMRFRLQIVFEYGAVATGQALAAEGYLAYVPIRPFVANLGPAQIASEADELARVANRVIAMPDVDRHRVALMGHSRGAILALMVPVKRKDLAAVVLTAPTRIPPRFLGDTFDRTRSMPTPVLLMAENGDELGGLAAVQDIDAQLKRRRQDDHRTIRYDGGGGHFLFVRKDYWWDDLKTFLGEKLSQP